MESFESMLFGPRMRPLYAFVDELKVGLTRCQSCGDIVERMTTVFNGRIISRAELLTMRERVGEDVWIDERKNWRCLCRFCAQIETARASAPLDLAGFYRWLKTTSAKPSTAHEYCVRVKRLLDKYEHAEIQAAIDSGDLVAGIVSMVPLKDAPNYRRALMKYDEFLRKRKT